MKIFKGIMVLLVMMLIVVGCQKVEKPSDEEVPDKNEVPFVRSASKVVKDDKTKSTITSQESYQIGTYITISIYDEKEVPSTVFDEIFYTIYDFEKMMSKNIEMTNVDQINDSAGVSPVEVPEVLYDLIDLSINYGEMSNGLFDISIGPVVNLWGIGTDDAAIPDDDELKAAMEKVDYRKIELDPEKNTVFLPEEGMVLDLGAVAKGYIADEVKKVIQKNGYESAIINLGGNVLTVGLKPNSDHWSVGVRDPQSEMGGLVGILNLEDNAIVSSGVYERFFMKDNVRYHHLINPDTGYPEQSNLLSISIVTGASVDGDALSTAGFLMGFEKGYDFIESLEGVDAMFVLDDGSIYMTSGIESKFLLTNNKYTIKSK
jgi:thiamine biosynthesis lipoprotein